MAIPASKVKAVCTQAEAALVRASRKPALQGHSVAELKRYIVRARRLAEKWEGQGRAQVRSRARQVGAVERDANTALKGEIFRDALARFTARLAELEAAGTPAGRKPSKPTKARRSATHRAVRAEVRQDLSDHKLALKAKRRKAAAKSKAKTLVKSAKPATSSTAEQERKTTGGAVTEATPVIKKSAKKLIPPAQAPPRAKKLVGGATVANQRTAIAAAKKARVAASSKSSRVRGHVLARGRRAQAARDARN